jgi:uncharacterized membrane protein YqgA involved in biofilm formation
VSPSPITVLDAVAAVLAGSLGIAVSAAAIAVMSARALVRAHGSHDGRGTRLLDAATGILGAMFAVVVAACLLRLYL